MRWIPDTTGRFGLRPHFERTEIDQQCERLVTEFLRSRGAVRWPLSTDELTVLVEQNVSELDVYADLDDDGQDVEGVTELLPTGEVRIRVHARLGGDPRMENRLRMTVAHELGHVRFHMPLWVEEQVGGKSSGPGRVVGCTPDSMLASDSVDWMEWQAAYAAGAILMPATPLRRVVARCFDDPGDAMALPEDSPAGRDLQTVVQRTFAVSRPAARVRLLQHGYLTES